MIQEKDMDKEIVIQEKTSQVSSPIFDAVYANNIDKVLSLVKTSDINQTDNNGNTPLMIAVDKNYIGIVRLLINNGAYTKTKNKNCEDAISIANKKNNTEVAKILKESQKMISPYVRNIIIDALQENKTDVIKQLIKTTLNVDAAIVDLRERKSLLAVASEYNCADTIEFLLNEKAEDVANALNTAAQKNNVLAAETILSNSNIKFFLRYDNARYTTTYIPVDDDYKEVALYHAVKNNAVDVAKLLIKYGANVNCDIHVLGCAYGAPLCTAVMRNYEEMVKLLVSFGADINIKYNGGETLISYARNNRCSSVIIDILNNPSLASQSQETAQLQDNKSSVRLGIVFFVIAIIVAVILSRV